MSKGSTFERWFCTELSLWWSWGKHNDLFWRTAGSGARAKTRGRKGARTYGHAGDVCATHPDGDPLIRAITFELKRGYNRASLFDLLDKAPTAKPQTYEEWIAQATESATQADSYSWAIVHKRDRRECLITMPEKLYGHIVIKNRHLINTISHFTFEDKLYYTFPLGVFLEQTNPDSLRKLPC